MINPIIKVESGTRYYPITGDSYKELDGISWKDMPINEVVYIKDEKYILLSYDLLKHEVILKPFYSLL